MIVYYLNIVILFANFFASLALIFRLFAKDSVVYVLNTWQRSTLKAVLIMFCICHLHSIDGDNFHEIQLHDLLKDVGMLGLVIFVHVYMHRRKFK
jgi:hypothetical protein